MRLGGVGGGTETAQSAFSTAFLPLAVLFLVPVAGAVRLPRDAGAVATGHR